MKFETKFNCDLIIDFLLALNEEEKELFPPYVGKSIDISNYILPTDYVYFLRKFNGFSFFGDEILGIGNKQDDILSIVEREQNETNNLMPRYIIPFSAVGNGDYYCFDLKKGLDENGASPVIYWQWNYSSAENYEIVNDSFVEWLKELIEDCLEDESE